jgi:hypothetical protein
VLKYRRAYVLWTIILGVAKRHLCGLARVLREEMRAIKEFIVKFYGD